VGGGLILIGALVLTNFAIGRLADVPQLHRFLSPPPAVIVENETSTVVGRNFDARIDAFGYIELVRRGA